jgi:dolichyl-phosphate beta-glucosyltransferase
MQKTAIIVPCYNEAQRLNSHAFIQAASEDRNLLFIFVNDGSTDRTLEAIKGLHHANPLQISYIDLQKNSGKAEAVRRGFLAAFKSDFTNIGYWDADLATPLASIRTFCGILDASNTPMVIGSRVKLLGRQIERRALRHYLGRFFATAASLILRLSVYDTQCGAKIFKNSDNLKNVFRDPFQVSWIFDVELLARFLIIERQTNDLAGANWVEYPLEHWHDVKYSKIGWGSYFMSGVDLLKLTALLYVPFFNHRYTSSLLRIPAEGGSATITEIDIKNR